MSVERENRSTWLRRRRVLRLLADAPHGRADLKIIARFSIEIFGLVTVSLSTVFDGIRGFSDQDLRWFSFCFHRQSCQRIGRSQR